MSKEIIKIEIIQTTRVNMETAQQEHSREITKFLYNKILKLKDVQINTSYKTIKYTNTVLIPSPDEIMFESIIHYPKIIDS